MDNCCLCFGRNVLASVMVDFVFVGDLRLKVKKQLFTRASISLALAYSGRGLPGLFPPGSLSVHKKMV